MQFLFCRLTHDISIDNFDFINDDYYEFEKDFSINRENDNDAQADDDDEEVSREPTCNECGNRRTSADISGSNNFYTTKYVQRYGSASCSSCSSFHSHRNNDVMKVPASSFSSSSISPPPPSPSHNSYSLHNSSKSSSSPSIPQHVEVSYSVTLHYSSW